MGNMRLSSLSIKNIHKKQYEDLILFEKQKMNTIDYFGLIVRRLSLLFIYEILYFFCTDI